MLQVQLAFQQTSDSVQLPIRKGFCELLIYYRGSPAYLILEPGKASAEVSFWKIFPFELTGEEASTKRAVSHHSYIEFLSNRKH